MIGRDPSCQIILEPNQYLNVSRRHAAIRPLYPWEMAYLAGKFVT
jgi:hypothetical protein